MPSTKSIKVMDMGIYMAASEWTCFPSKWESDLSRALLFLVGFVTPCSLDIGFHRTLCYV